MDSDITETFDESMDCLYEAINELNSLIDDQPSSVVQARTSY